jgi:hypothetical protein
MCINKASAKTGMGCAVACCTVHIHETHTTHVTRPGPIHNMARFSPSMSLACATGFKTGLKLCTQFWLESLNGRDHFENRAYVGGQY